MQTCQRPQGCRGKSVAGGFSKTRPALLRQRDRRKRKLYAYARILAKDLPRADSFGRRCKRSLVGIADEEGKLLGFLKIREPAVIGGLPTEGYGMLEFFIRFPERVRGVMLYSTCGTEDDVIVLPMESYSAGAPLRADEVYKISREGHLLDRERPETFISLIETFLEAEFYEGFRRKMERKSEVHRTLNAGREGNAMSLFRSLFFVFAAGLALTGCSGAFWGGTAGGTAATGSAYELRARQQMEKIEGQYKRGEIDQREYEIRKDQIKEGSLAY
jgi:hypothetical protein